MISYQTNLYSFVRKNTIECYTELKLHGNVECINLLMHDLCIKEVYFIQNKHKTNAEFNNLTLDELFKDNQKIFNTNLYSKLRVETFNHTVIIPECIDPEIEYIFRIIYEPSPNNNFINFISSDDKSYEIFSFAFFPRVENSSHPIESIFAYPENFNILAPGTLIRKDKRSKIVFSSYLSKGILHIPFVLGTFKYVDVSHGNLRAKVYFPQIFNIGTEFKQDLILISKYLNTMFLTKDFSFQIVFSSCNFSTVSQNIIFLPLSIFPLNGVDQNIFARLQICEMLSKMIFANLKCTDYWLGVSLREYLASIFVREILGENEINFKTKNDCEFVYENDVYESPLINEFDKKNQDQSYMFYSFKLDKTAHFKLVKGRLFFQLIENQISRALLEKIIVNILSKIEINTLDFVKTIKDVCGKDLTYLFDYYVYKPGIVECIITYEVDKKGRVDVAVKQMGTSLKNNSNKRLPGDIKFKVYEQEGVFEHKITGDALTFQCHYRTKKKKKPEQNIPRGSFEKDVQEKSCFEEADLDDTKDQVLESNTGQILFMRADPCFEYIAKIRIEQPDFMFIEQLLTEKSIDSQIDAILSLKEKPSEETLQALERILNDTHAFYKIRLLVFQVFSMIKSEAKTDLYEDTKEEKTYNFGFQRSMQYFVKKNCIPGSTIPKPNDFAIFTSYFIQKFLANSLSVTDPEIEKKYNERVVKSKNIIIAFLMNIVKYNCNEDEAFYGSSLQNVFSHGAISNSNYVSSIIESLSYQICSESLVDLNPIIQELERKREMDILFPSYQNLITRSILNCYKRLCFYNLINLDINMIKGMCGKENCVMIREEAINILCTCFIEESFDFIKTLFFEESRYIKFYIVSIFKSLMEVCVNVEKEQIKKPCSKAMNDCGLKIKNTPKEVKIQEHVQDKIIANILPENDTNPYKGAELPEIEINEDVIQTDSNKKEEREKSLVSSVESEDTSNDKGNNYTPVIICKNVNYEKNYIEDKDNSGKNNIIPNKIIAYNEQKISEDSSLSLNDRTEYLHACIDLKLPTDESMQCRYNQKFRSVFKNKAFFYEALKKYYYDPLLLERITDVIYLIENCNRKYQADERIIQIEKPSFIIRLYTNSSVNLKISDEMIREFNQIKRKRIEEPIKQLMPPKVIPPSTPYKIRFQRYDIIELKIDYFVHKYLSYIKEFSKKRQICSEINENEIINDNIMHEYGSKICTQEKIPDYVNNDLSNNNRGIDDIDQDGKTHSVIICPDDDISKIKEYKSSSFNIDLPFTSLAHICGLSLTQSQYQAFVIFVILKNIKKHKYFVKLNLEIPKIEEVSEFINSLHLQFVHFYTSTRVGTQLYLNAKALETYTEQIVNEMTLFKPIILMSGELKIACAELLQELCNSTDIEYFLSPVEITSENQNYYDISRIPQDLTTIKKNFESEKYSFDVFVKCVELLFINFLEYNSDGDLNLIARNLLLKTRNIMVNKILTLIVEDGESIKRLQGVVDENLNITCSILEHQTFIEVLKIYKHSKHAYQQITKILVDASHQKESLQFLNLPDTPEYKKHIKKKLSLNMIIEKSKNNEYISVGHVLYDIGILVKNCVIINGNTSWIVRVCRKMENYVKKELAICFGLRFMGTIKRDGNQ